MTFFNFFIMSKTGKCWPVRHCVLESFSGSDSTNAVMKYMPRPVANPADKDYHRN